MDLHWDDVAERTGETFQVGVGETELTLTLTGVGQLPHARRAGGAFRLEFLGPAGPLLPQAIYPVAGRDFDEEIFLVPIACSAEGVNYEAIYT